MPTYRDARRVQRAETMRRRQIRRAKYGSDLRGSAPVVTDRKAA